MGFSYFWIAVYVSLFLWVVNCSVFRAKIEFANFGASFQTRAAVQFIELKLAFRAAEMGESLQRLWSGLI